MSFVSQPITLQSLFGQNRTIGPITVQVVVREEANDTLTITKQPVQLGASIADHAYMEPAAFSMGILQQSDAGISGLIDTFSGAGGNGLAQIYSQFLSLQSSRVPFNVITPKRVYTNMLMSVLRQVTDKQTENILSLNVSFQQVNIVTIGVARVPAANQKSPQVTQGTSNTGKQSALYTGAQTIGIVP